MPFAIGGNQLDTGYEVSNSLRFNDDDDPFLARTPSSSGSRTKATVSFWVKRGNLESSGNHYILEASSSTSPFNMTRVRFGDDFLIIDNTLNGNAGNGFYFQSTRKYRDPSAWYHIFFSVDVTQANATDGWELYVNGVEQTKALDFWVQNANLEWSQSGVQMNIGRRHDNGTEHLDGYLAEFHYIDGTIKSHSDFGEFNDNGVWIPKKYDGGSYGTNGFYLEFKQTGTSANSSGIGADTSGNDNHFTPSNLAAIDITTDTCTNNFCTLNSVDNDGVVLSNGNCDFDTSGGSDEGVRGTIGVLRGKWYYECKITNSAGLSAGNVGYSQSPMRLTDNPRGGQCVVINGSLSVNLYNFSSSTVVLDASSGIGQNDIVGVALNLDDNEITFFKNNSQIGSTQSIASGLLQGDFFLPCMFDDGGVNDVVGSFNFGQPTFSGTDQSDAEGHGSFEYAPPSGYFALCTKNLAEYG